MRNAGPDFGGISTDDRISWNILGYKSAGYSVDKISSGRLVGVRAYLGDYRSGLDDGAPSDSDIVLYDGASPDPYIFINIDISTYLGAPAALSLVGILEGGRPKKCNVGSDKTLLTNDDFHRIKNSAVSADQHLVANRDIIPIVACEWRLDYYFVSDTASFGDGRE